MASYTISPIWGAGAQLFDNNGIPLVGGKIYTYYAGSTTPLTTYTNPIGTVANTNPIITNSAGRLVNEIWFPVSGSYKFVLKDANDVLIATYDNIPTTPQPPIVNDASSISYQQGYEVTAGNFTVGATYLITSVGNTDFVAIGAAANITGILFTATGVGSGTGEAAYSRTVQQKLQETVSVKDFGAVGDGVTDDTVAIQAALDSGAGLVEAPDSVYLITNTLIVPDNVTFVGKGRAITNIDIGDDVVGIELGSYSQLRGFKISTLVAHTNNGVDAGTPSRGGGRTIIADVWVDNVGNDGIQVRNGNLGTIRDVICTNNGRDGINFTTETQDNNSWKLEGVIDVRSNTRDGLHFAAGTYLSDPYAPRTNSCDYVVAQENGRYGVYCGTRNNNFVAYLEANVTKDLYLDTYANGCNIVLLDIGSAGTITDNSQGSQISIHSAQADYVREYITKVTFSGKSGRGWQINNDDGAPGILSATKKSANTYSFSQIAGASNALTWFEHTSAKHTLGATGGFVTSTSFVSISSGVATTVASFGVANEDAFCGILYVRDAAGTLFGSSAIVTNFTNDGAQSLNLSSVTNGAAGSSLTVSGGNVQFTHTFGSSRTFAVTVVQFGLGKSI